MRVIASFTCWVVLWMAAGTAVGLLFGTPRTGTLDGFIFAVLATFAWPWILPKFIDDWMDDNYNPIW